MPAGESWARRWAGKRAVYQAAVPAGAQEVGLTPHCGNLQPQQRISPHIHPPSAAHRPAPSSWPPPAPRRGWRARTCPAAPWPARRKRRRRGWRRPRLPGRDAGGEGRGRVSGGGCASRSQLSGSTTTQVGQQTTQPWAAHPGRRQRPRRRRLPMRRLRCRGSRPAQPCSRSTRCATASALRTQRGPVHATTIQSACHDVSRP